MNAMLLLTKLLQRGGGTEYRYELRQARDGCLYTASEFYAHYGEEEWLKQWKQAERVDKWSQHWELAERVAPRELAAGVMELLNLVEAMRSFSGNAGANEMRQWRDLGHHEAVRQETDDQWAETGQARTLAGMSATPDPAQESNDKCMTSQASSETWARSAAPASQSPKNREMPGGLQNEEDQWREPEEAQKLADPQRPSAPLDPPDRSKESEASRNPNQESMQSLLSSGTWAASAAPAAANQAMATDTGAKPESCMQQALAPRPPPPPPPAVSSVIGPPPGLTLQCQVPPKAKDIDALKAREIEALKRVFYCPLCQVGPVCGVHRGDLEAVVRLDGQCR